MSGQLPVKHIEAETVEQAIELLTSDDDTRIVANGYSLVPLLKDGIETPDRLIDISQIDTLRGISTDGATTRIGALTTHNQIAASSTVQSRACALATAANSVGDYMAKQQGTIGGNLVFASPKYDPPGAVLALNGEVVVQGSDGQRQIDADDWFQGPDETALGPNELVTEVVLPRTAHSGYIRTSEYSGYAIVSVAATLEINDGMINEARVAVNGARPYPIRLSNVEEALRNERVDEDLPARAAATALQETDPETLLANEAASGTHRLQLVRAYCERAIDRASQNQQAATR